MESDSKRCFKCGETKPISSFYKHKMMADGHLNKCKQCAKADVRANRSARIDYYHAHDRERNRRPERREKRAVYLKNRRSRSPEKFAARFAVSNAIRDGRLIKGPCEVCGHPDTEGHHDDYNKPLDVRWLCFIHHCEVHGHIATAGRWRSESSASPF